MHYTKGILATIVSLGLALALLLPLSVTSANGPTVTVGIATPAEVDPGSSFIANVTVSYVTDFDSCGFDVTYDKTVVTVTNVTGGVIGGQAITVGPGDWVYIPAGPDPGRIRVIAVKSGPPTGVNGTGYLAQIHFRAVGSAGSSSSINPQNVTMYDYRAARISTTTLGASVSIKGPPPTQYTITFDTDPEATGSITFAGVTFSDGNTVNKAAGTYNITAVPGAGYSFAGWQTTGGLSVAAPGSISTTCTVTGNGMLRMVQTPPVGGTAYPPNKLVMLLPWIALGAAIVVAASLLVQRRRGATK